MTPGIYGQSSNEGTKSELNYPFNKSCIIEVYQWAEGFVMQRVAIYDEGKIAFRVYRDGAWHNNGAWIKY